MESRFILFVAAAVVLVLVLGGSSGESVTLEGEIDHTEATDTNRQRGSGYYLVNEDIRIRLRGEGLRPSMEGERVEVTGLSVRSYLSGGSEEVLLVDSIKIIGRGSGGESGSGQAVTVYLYVV